VKSQLVPFAESRPLKSWFAWPEWLVPSKPEVMSGQVPHSYPIADDIRVGIMICWESLFAHHARLLVNDGATLLVMLANEGWFGGSAAGAQHNLTARMRAVETRRSVIVASNMGPPLVIDPYGRLLADTSPGAGMQWATAAAPLVKELSLYARHGDVLVLSCALLAVAILLKAWWEKRLKSTHPVTALRSGHLRASRTPSHSRRAT
jgi:apolipoprotein N-acyltransferase